MSEDVRQLAADEWVEILQDDEVTREINRKIFGILYSADDYTLNGGEIARRLNTDAPILHTLRKDINAQVLHHANRIAKKYDVNPFTDRPDRKGRQCWNFFFHGKQIGQHFWWQLKPNLIEAMRRIYGDTEPLESIVDVPSAPEGKQKQYYVTRYERNPTNRAAAIMWHREQHGNLCCHVCGFDFEAIYGEWGADFIEVHHIKPLSSYDEEINPDPKTDLVCLCSNCHSMINRKRDNILTPEELKSIVKGA